MSIRELEPQVVDLLLGQSQQELLVLAFQPRSSLDTIQRVFRKQTNPIKMSISISHASLRFLKDPKPWNGLVSSLSFLLRHLTGDQSTCFKLLATPPFS